MLACPRCGFFHSDADVTCLKCGTHLRPIGRPDPLAPPGFEVIELPRARGSRWRNLWMHIAARLRRAGFFVRRALQSDLPAGVHHRNPWLAGMLGLIPGVGQLYNHQPKRAGILFLFVGGFFGFAALTWYHPWSNFFLLLTFFVWIYGWHDAFITARAINRDTQYWTVTLAYFCAWIFLFSFCSIVGQFVLGAKLISFRYIFFDDMAPFLRTGERVGLNRWAYAHGAPRLGDVAYVTNYDAHPRELALEKPSQVQSNWILVQPRNYIERIVGLPGDVFERRDGAFFRNGKPVPPAEQPIVQDQIPGSFTLKAPPDRYIILLSYTGEDIDPSNAIGIGSIPFGWIDTYTVKNGRLNVKVHSDYSDEIFTRAPKMGQGWICHNWEAQNFVPVKDIQARVAFVYQPPPARRWLR